MSFSVKCYLYSHMINIHTVQKKWVCKEKNEDGSVCGRSYAKVSKNF